ncbi:MAG: hypothetical protein WAN01_06620, partial [Bradyrhizobium sp.]
SFSWFARRRNETLPLSLMLMLLVNLGGSHFHFVRISSPQGTRRVPNRERPLNFVGAADSHH